MEATPNTRRMARRTSQTTNYNPRIKKPKTAGLNSQNPKRATPKITAQNHHTLTTKFQKAHALKHCTSGH
jgi:hypothetical protein